MKSSQSVALLSSSVNIRAHIGKAGFSDKMPIHGLPFPSRRKRNAVSGPGDQLALPGKQKSFFKPHVSPLRLAFPYARCGPPSSCHQAASPESKRFPDPMQLPRKDNTAPLSSWGYPPHGGPHGTQKRRSRKNASSASTAPSRAATALPAIRQPERNTANGRLPAFRKCPPDLPSPATPARGGC